MPDNLLSQLDAPGLDHYELLTLMGFHWRGSCTTEDNSVLYPCTESYVVKIRTKNDQIVSIEPGTGYSDAALASLKEKVRTTLIESSGSVIRADILFSSKPVKGSFRATKDRLQIYPPPENAPRPGVLSADHPFILEFPLKSSSDGFVTNNRAMRRALELTWTLNALLRTSITRIGPRAQHIWGLIETAQLQAPAQQNVKWVQQYYAIDNLPIQYANFSPPTSDQIRVIRHDEYYDSPFIMTDDLVLPDSISLLLDKAEGLDLLERRRFIRAVRWMYAATPLHFHLISSCYIALVSAVEALMPDAERQENCPTCHKDRSPGPTQRFQNFVESYAPASDPEEKNRKRLYRIRSDLAHGCDLLRFDSAPWDWSLNTTSETEREAFDQLFRIVRKVIVNWLLGK
jgi:hypothetical protein